MEGTTALRTSVGCSGLEWKFCSTMVVASVGHIGDAQCCGIRPFSPYFWVRRERRW